MTITRNGDQIQHSPTPTRTKWISPSPTRPKCTPRDVPLEFRAPSTNTPPRPGNTQWGAHEACEPDVGTPKIDQFPRMVRCWRAPPSSGRRLSGDPCGGRARARGRDLLGGAATRSSPTRSPQPASPPPRCSRHCHTPHQRARDHRRSKRRPAAHEAHPARRVARPVPDGHPPTPTQRASRTLIARTDGDRPGSIEAVA
jgi:hypothetical protein